MGLRNPRLSLALILIFAIAPVGLAQSAMWQTLFDAGVKAGDAGHYAEAENQLSAALKNAEGQADKGLSLAKTLKRLASLYQTQGKFSESDASMRRALAIDEKLFGPESTEVAADLSMVATVARHQNRYQESEANYKKALSILEKAPGDNSADLAAVSTNMAMVYQDMGRYDQVEGLLKRALSLSEKREGPDSPAVAAAMEAIARFYALQNRAAEAEPLMKQALAIKEKKLGLGNKELCGELSSLGKLYASQGKLSDAETYLKRALTLKERECGQDSAEIATSLLDLSDFYYDQERYEDAMPLIERAVSLREKALGKVHPDVASALNKQALTLTQQNQYDRAEPIYERVLAIDTHCYGPTSREYARDLANLALLYLDQGKYAKAEPLYQKSLSILEQALGPDHPDVAAALNNLGWLYRNEGKFQAAEPLIKRGLEIRVKAWGATHPAVARNLANLAEIYECQGQWAAAEAVLKRSLEIEDATLPSDTIERTPSLRELAQVYDNLANAKEAEAVYRRILAIDEKAAVDDGALAGDLDALATVLNRQGKKAEAEPLEKRALYIKEKLPGALLAEGARGMGSSSEPNDPFTGRDIKDKWALCIGISNFKDPNINLRYAAKDATDFRNYLVNEAHFKADHVRLLTDKQASRASIISTLGEQWLKRLANRDDLVVLYISSHGSSAKREASNANFIVPYDGNFDNIVFNGIPMQWLTAGIRELVHCDRIVLVMDVCHGGAVAQGAKGIRREHGFNTRQVVAGRGQVVLASSQADQISWESKKYPNGVFTRRLLEGLHRHGKHTKLNEAFEYMREMVEEEVLRDRAQVQTPMLITRWWKGDDLPLAVVPKSPRPGLESTAQEKAPPATPSAPAAKVGAPNRPQPGKKK